MDKFAIIVAGGTGSRMGSALPKQFLPLAGIPVLMHSIESFHAADPSIKIIVALPIQYVEQWHELCIAHSFCILHELSPGGSTRYESVKNALSLVTADGLVAIHDGVRPLASRELIESAYRQAADLGSAIPAATVIDSVRILEGNENRPVDRSVLRLVQTPQVFLSSLIINAYNRAASGNYTDDACVMEAAGEKVHLIPGELHNLKITYPEDLLFAEALLINRGKS